MTRCLETGHSVEIFFEDNNRNSDSFISVQLKNDENGFVREFKQSITSPTHYHPYELRGCNIYFSRSFNYDYGTREPLPNNHTGIWKYDYQGLGEEVLRIGETVSGKREDYRTYYQNDFRISYDEAYISLITNFLSHPDYSLVIKDIETKDDVFQLFLTELLEIDRQYAGSFGFLGWTDNSRYFWTSLFDGAYTKGWVRVDSTDWSYQAFLAPPDRTLNGYPLNIETGWVPFIPGNLWSGVVEMDEQLSKERAATGATLDLYLYNVFTEEKILVADTDATLWQDVGLEWVDNKTIRYLLPDGKEMTFILPS